MRRKTADKKLIKIAISGIIILALSASVSSAPNQKLKDKFNVKQIKTDLDISGIDPRTKYGYVSAFYKNSADASETIALKPEDAFREDGEEPKTGPVKGFLNGAEVTETALIWDDKCNSYSWNVDIPEDAVYEISISYMASDNDSVPVMRSILTDGRLPFHEAGNFLLPRVFTESENVTLNPDGDEISPVLKQKKAWQTVKVRDLSAAVERPLKFFLAKGEHKISIAYSTCDIFLSGVELVPPEKIPSYEEYFALASGNYKGGKLTIEAETAPERSMPSLRRGSSGSPDVSPFEPGKVVQNMIGGWYWRKPHDMITYTIDVPDNGYYKLVLNSRQDAVYSAAVFRQITIDGKVPFKEVSAYKFDHTGNRYRHVAIGKNEDEPYLFYLTRGKHSLGFSVVLGEYSDVIDAVYQLGDRLAKQYREIVAVAGINPDPYYDYELGEKIPQTIEAMQVSVDDLKNIAAMAEAVSGRTAATSSLEAHAGELKAMLEDLETLPGKLNSIYNIQSSIISFAEEISVGPLALDCLYLMDPDEPVPDRKGSAWDSLRAFVMEFIRSFTKNYDATTNTGEIAQDEIEVWIANSREYGELLQRLSSDKFTKETGIKVKVNILPAGSVSAGGLSPLMLTVISGDQPDVVVGSDGSSPVDLAIRDAAVDMREYEDFDEIYSRFLPGTFEGVTYNGGIYAVPLTMDLPVLLYRTDIMSELGLKVPETWDELTQNTFPSLKQSQYDFYLSSGVGSSSAAGTAGPAFMNFSMFLYQHGGDLYTQDGLSSLLDSDAAYRAFKQWTELYIRFDIDVQADLLNHFRKGDIPLAMGTLYDYSRIRFAAPELQGRWGIAQIPGIRSEDGRIDRTAAGSITTNIIFDNGNTRKHNAFRYLDWWMTADIQKQFASEIEMIAGPESRWYSANLEAFQALSWSSEDIETIMDWTPFFRIQRNVLGGYLTSRTIYNSWTETVLNKKPAREQLEKAYKETTMEMQRKQKEYGVTR